ncbi:MAG: hypothetical protein WAU01_07035, partial [Saprospiraceae bacterium]
MKYSVLFLLVFLVKISSYGQVEFVDSTDYGTVMTKEFVLQELNDDFDKVLQFENSLKAKENKYDVAVQYYIPIVFHFIDSDNIGISAFNDFAAAQIKLLNKNFSANSEVKLSHFDEYFKDRRGIIGNLTFYDFTPCSNEIYQHKTYYADQSLGFSKISFDHRTFSAVNEVLPKFELSSVINVWVTDLSVSCDGFAS